MSNRVTGGGRSGRGSDHPVDAYHDDDRTWGVYPGPWHVNHLSAVFAFDD
jgi:hypothetical protein